MAGRWFLVMMTCAIVIMMDNSAHNAQADIIEITVKVPSSTASLHCEILTNFSQVCDDLNVAIYYANAVYGNMTINESQNTSIHILIPSGTHYVTTQTNFGGGADVQFIGTESDVRVICDFLVDKDTYDINEIHTWYFNQSSYISNFSEAVLDIYNCINVTLDHISLLNNYGNGRVLEPLRGNSGSVAIGYNQLSNSTTKPTLTISYCNFIGNRAMGYLSPERAVTGRVFIGRGGGMGLYLNESRQELHISISDCLFERNMALLFGGGLYILTTSYETVQHVIEIRNTQFIGNVGQSGGAGMQLSMLSSGDTNRPHRFLFSDCLFQRNTGSSGGGIYIFLDNNGNFVKFERCNFTDNTGLGMQQDFGAAIALSYLVRFAQRVTSTRHEIVNCSFVRNTSPNGIFTLGYAPVRFYGTNSFIENTGASLRIIGSLVDFEGEMEFANNKLSGDGALYLLSFGQIRFSKGTHVTFDGNIGNLGSSMVVETPASLVASSNLPYNPRCFILYEDNEATPLEWEDVSVLFRGNKALVSSAVYLSQTVGNACSWFNQTPPFFNNSFIPNWPIWSYDNNSNTGYYDAKNQVLSFGTSAQELSLQASDIYAWPGQELEVSLIGLDQFKHHTSSKTSFTFVPNQLYQQNTLNTSSNSVRFNSQIKILADSEDNNGLLEETFKFSYSLNSPSLQSFNKEGDTLGLVIVEEEFHNSGTSSNFTLHTLPCPGGYNFTTFPTTGDPEYECTCVDTSEEIVFCEDDKDTVVLKYGTWAAYNPTNSSTNVNLYFHSCPAGYCRCSFNSSTLGENNAGKMCVYQYRHSNPDKQCICEREGILCGRCKNGTGVSILLNRCVSCSDGLLTLIPLMIGIIVVVIVIIIMIDKPIPEWTLPFLFYIQNAPYAALFFPETFDSLGKYLYYFSSATSFYFVYDFCLSSNLSSVYSYLLRYIPALTASLIYFIIWLIRRKIMKKKTLDNYGSWWCILLMYSFVSYTSMSTLHCTSVPTNSTYKTRWFVSGDTECFAGEHIPLALLAMVMLVVCIFFTVFVAVLPLTKFSLFKNYLKPFAVSYKDDMKYWSGIELARRFLFLLALVPFPRNTVYVILLLVVSLCLYTYNLPYKTTAANILEITLQLNFLALLLLESMPIVKDELFVFSGQTSVGTCSNSFSSISFIVLLLIPIYYAPVVLLVIVAIVYLSLYLIKRWRNYKHESENILVRLHSECIQVVASDFTTQSINIDYSQEEFPLSNTH